MARLSALGETTHRRGVLAAVLLIFQVIMLVLFSVFAKYDPEADAKHDLNQRDRPSNVVTNYYPSEYPNRPVYGVEKDYCRKLHQIMNVNGKIKG